MVSPALVGRDEELSTLVTTVTAPPSVVVIEGESGIGKTRLLTELRGRPELAGRTVVTGWCRRIREPFPLGPVIEAARGLAGRLPARALSPVAGALRPLLPELADRLPPPPPPPEDRAAGRHQLFRALVELLTAAGPVVLVIEDLHWADDQTVDFLSYLLTTPPAGLSLVVTFRGEEVDPSVRALAAKLPAPVHRAEVVLELLDERETGELAAAILGIERVSGEFAGYLRTRTSGLPFAIEELLALLRARGDIVHRGGGYARRALAALDVPSGIRDPVLARISRLSDGARLVVRAAAVLQTPVPVPVLAATCQVPTAQVLAGLDELLDSGLFTEDGMAVGFRHLLAAQAVYGTLSGPRRRELHGRAAAALGSLQPPPLGQLAHHLRHAGRLAEWAEVAERAADQALELGHDAEAARLLEELLRHAPLDPDRRGRIATRLAQAAIETVEITPELTELLAGVLELELPAAVRGELAFRLALLHEAVGSDAGVVRRLYTTAVGDLADRPDLKAWAMMGLAIPTAPAVPLAEHRRWLHRMLQTLPNVDDSDFRLFLRGKAAMVQVLTGDRGWRELVGQIEAETRGAPRRRRAVNAYQSVGMAACYAGHHQDAARLLGAALVGAEAVESRKLSFRARSALALLDYCRGEWERLPGTVAALLDELADYPAARVDVEVVAGCLALAHGELDQAETRLSRVAAEAAGMGGYELVALATDAQARLAVVRDEPARAVEPIRELLATVDAKQLRMPVLRTLAAGVRVLAAVGHAAEARSLLDRTARDLAGLDAPLGPAVLRHAEGELLAAAGEWSAAGRELLAAADRYQPPGCRYEAAQARERAAECLLVAGVAGAQRPLLAALDSYRRLGARWDADRATGTARRYGIPVPARHRGGRRGYGERLSPREREVAARAAAGRTNREIAQELFLSPKTVDKHIGAALRKLGLRSRAELAGRVPSG